VICDMNMRPDMVHVNVTVVGVVSLGAGWGDPRGAGRGKEGSR